MVGQKSLESSMPATQETKVQPSSKGQRVSHSLNRNKDLHQSHSVNFAPSRKWTDEEVRRRQRNWPPTAGQYEISRSATLPPSRDVQLLPRKHYSPPRATQTATTHTGEDSLGLERKVWNHDGHRTITTQKVLPATPQISPVMDETHRPSCVSTLSDTTVSSMTSSEMRMSDMTKCTSISVKSRRPDLFMKENEEQEQKIEMTVDDAIDMYAAGFNDDNPSEGPTPPAISIENDEQRRSRQMSEALNDSILIPPPQVFTSRPSIATTRNSLAIISNAARPSSAIPSIPPLLPPTATRDQYGFLKASHHVSLSQYEAWYGPYALIQERRAKKWYAFMRSHDISTYNPATFPQRSPKTQRFVRKGIPAEWRGAAWYHYSGADTYKTRHPELYQRLVSRSSTSHLSETDKELIERDLHRTFPDNVRFKDPSTSLSPPTDGFISETPLLISLRRLLRAFAIHSPRIGYCQSLNFIGGLLLLFLPEEKAFWMLHLITRDYLPGTHEVSLEGANTDLWILMTLLKDHLPSIWNQMDSRDPHAANNTSTAAPRLPPVSLCCTSWFMALFIGTVPIESTLRIWDILFYEGPRTIFRVALGIFRICGPEIKRLSTSTRGAVDSGEIFQLVQNLPRKFLDVGMLLRVALDTKGAVDGEAIEKMRKVDQRGRAAGVMGRSLTEKTKVKRGGSLWRKRLG